MKYSALQQVVEEEEEEDNNDDVGDDDDDYDDDLKRANVRRSTTPTPAPTAPPTTSPTTGSTSSSSSSSSRKQQQQLLHPSGSSSVSSTGSRHTQNHHHHNPHARQECLLFLATVCGFLMLVAALSLHNNEWVGGDQYLLNGGATHHDMEYYAVEPLSSTDDNGVNHQNSYNDNFNNSYNSYNSGGLRGHPPPSERMPPIQVAPYEEEEESATDTWWEQEGNGEAEDMTGRRPRDPKEDSAEEDNTRAPLPDTVLSQDDDDNDNDQEDAYSTLPLYYGKEDQYVTPLETQPKEEAARMEDEHGQEP